MTCNKYKSPRRFLIHPPSAPHQTISTCSFIPLTTTDEKSMNARKLISAVFAFAFFLILSSVVSQEKKIVRKRRERNGPRPKVESFIYAKNISGLFYFYIFLWPLQNFACFILRKPTHARESGQNSKMFLSPKRNVKFMRYF